VRALLVLLCLAATAAADEPRAFLETDAPREAFFLGEPFDVTLRIGVDREFFEESVVPMFRRRMDVNAKVIAPFFGTPAPVEGERTLSIAFNDDVVELARGPDRVVNGRTFAVIEIGRTCRPERTGEFTVPAPRLEYAWSKEFREDFISGRVPVARLDAAVAGRALTLRILPLPEQGRPASFTGAVGRFTVSARAEPLDVEVGESLKFTMVIRGEGDLGRFGTPRLETVTGFHVYGAIEERGADHRTITWDLAPTVGGTEKIPAVPFAFFDPAAAAYEVVSTQPIPLTVRGDAPAPPAGGGRAWIYVLAALVILGAAIGILLRSRAKARVDRAVEPDPAEVFKAALDRPGADLAGAFTDYLATILAVPAAAVIGPDLPDRLAAAGVPPGVCARAADLVETLVGSRYGGEAEEGLETEVRAVVIELSTASRAE
jgi:hypothetical protein